MMTYSPYYYLGQDVSGPGLRWVTHPEEAVAWFKQQLTKFYAMPAKLGALRSRAAAVSTALAAKNPVAAAQASNIATQAARMQTEHTSLLSRVSEMLGKLGQFGVKLPGLEGYAAVPPANLGALPLVVVGILAGTGAAVALGIAALFKDYAKQASLLEQIEKGNLSPAEAAAIAKATKTGGLFGAGLGPLVPLAIGGLALYFFAPQLKRALAR